MEAIDESQIVEITGNYTNLISILFILVLQLKLPQNSVLLSDYGK